VNADEIDRLSRSREGDARVSEHHKAQRDQKYCNDSFCVHIESLLTLFCSLPAGAFCASQQQFVSAIIRSLPRP
jgi:hypothetical protein